MIEIFRSALLRWAQALRTIAGVPDYERYLAHMRTAHPHDRAMTRSEFSVTRMGDRYDRPGSRCC
ncbi:MAG TPA: YbdD/YjiX family protein [Gemmatimonadaceae bacterium]|nr:YbdD/YjiX family protein [Gemmatimonadaceae bacterium]